MKRTVNKSVSDTSELQLKIKNITEENKKLRQTVEQKATEIEHLLEQLGEDVTAYDLGVRSAVHKKVLELRLSDVSPSKLSRSSASDGECTSTYSEISGITSILVDSPPSGRQTKTRLLTDRLKPEIIELADLRFKGGGVKTCSVLTPAEEEEDDPFGGVYLGPPDSLPPKKTVQFNSISDGIAMEEHPLADKLIGTRRRHDSDLSSDTEHDRMEQLNVASLQDLDDDIDPTRSLLS
ncbi:uncharacterized protein LOC121382253 [Gigantopelta aegis]|uniref:uncharacterized protein LOC121382253 n=1 Tax=Gigantopelta aegis TaxID=1735272 RepID=UPI001B889868|nr:uncharacterized protein LOC121382253 [Gigantopelta aegis]